MGFVTHQFDVWHFVKNIKKRLHKVGKNKSCENLQKWTKSIPNQRNGDEELLPEKWLNILFHVQNIHKWRTGEP